MSNQVELKVALFIDCENISYKYIDDIIAELANYGNVNVRKAYGDWKNESLKNWDKELFNYSLEPIHQPPYTTNKNATDIKMTVDIMKTLCQNNKIDYVALATSDSDFTPLVTEIKSQGIQVIGFGEEKTSNVLQKACSEFIEVGKSSKGDNLQKNIKLINMLNEAILNKKRDDGFSLVSEVGTYLKNKHSINSKKYGNFRSWGEILKQLTTTFEIKMVNSTMLVKAI